MPTSWPASAILTKTMSIFQKISLIKTKRGEKDFVYCTINLYFSGVSTLIRRSSEIASTAFV